MKTFIYVSTTLVVILFSSFLFIVGNKLYGRGHDIQPIVVKCTINCQGDVRNEIHKLDSLIEVINTQEKQLNEHYTLFMKAREEDADLVKILSCVGAFVLAILAFFGINSYKDLQAKMLERAEIEAARIANKKLSSIAQSEVSKQIRTKIQNKEFLSHAKEDIKMQIITERLVPLEEEVNRIKGGNNSERTDEVTDTNQDPTIDFTPMNSIIEHVAQKALEQKSNINISISPETKSGEPTKEKE